MADFRRRLSEIRDRVNANFDRILNEEIEGPERERVPSVIERLQNFRQEQNPRRRIRRTIPVRQVTFKVAVLKSGVTYYRSSRDATPACRVVVSLNLDSQQFRQALHNAIPGLTGDFEFCRINGRREVIPLLETCPGEIHSNRALGRSNLYLRATQLPPSGQQTCASTAPNASQVQLASTEITREILETNVPSDDPSSNIPAPSAQLQAARNGASPHTSDIVMDWELKDTDDNIPIESPVTFPQNDFTLAEVLENVMAENQEEERVVVVARRRNAIRAMLMGMAKPGFLWNKVPQVEFVGEMADDYGGPRREFLRLLMVEVHSSFGVFEGHPGNLLFSYDVEALSKRKYFTAGKLTAWSIFHNGPGPRGLNRNLFLMMCGQRAEVTERVPDLPVDMVTRQNIEKIWNCSSSLQLQELKEDLGDWIASCGMPSIYGSSIDSLPSLRCAVVEHHIFHRLASMVTQYKDGFNSCGCLWQVVERNWMQFLPVFTNTGEKLERSCMQSLFTIKWSPVGSNRREMEEETIFLWDWWLLAIQDGEVDISFEQLLIFVSGADTIPSLGFSPSPSIEFYDKEPGERRLPYASTCSLTIFLPRGVESEGDFKEMMEMSIKGSRGFGKV